MKVDLKLFSLFIVIPLCSLLVIYSAGYNPDTSIQLASWLPIEIHSKAFLKQIVNLAIGIMVMLLVTKINFKYIFNLGPSVYLLTLILLVAVLLIGLKSHGSVRWLPMGPVRFQPSEFAKASMILFFAWYLSKYTSQRYRLSWKALLIPLVLIFIPLVLIFKQPDLGTALIVAAIPVSMLLLAGIDRKILLVLFSLMLLSAPIVWSFVLKPYHKDRILTLLDPEQDPYGKGYHIIQSKIAVGSGSISGKGFLNGSQTQLEFLPERTTDFVFSVLAEEWGFFGCLFVLLLYLALILRLFALAEKCETPFQVYFCFGFAIMLAIHVFVNVGMVIGLLPVVGLPLPLFSYGGSAMLIIMFLAGIALNISSKRQEL